MIDSELHFKESHKIIPPFRFGIVEFDIFRGGYPRVKNFDFILKLRLKTILSLIPDPPQDFLKEFCSNHDIKSVHIQVDRAKDSVPLSNIKVFQALQIIIDPENHPIYIHCPNGANVTGLVIVCLRKLQMWSLPVAKIEFTRYTRDGLISSEETEFADSFGDSSNGTNITVSLSLSSESSETSPPPSGSNNSNSPPLNTSQRTQIASYIATVSPQIGLELEMPLKLPLWLWSGYIPVTFLKSVVPPLSSSQLVSLGFISPPTSSSYQNIAVPISLTYGHPKIRIRLHPEQLPSLISYHIQTSILNIQTPYNLSLKPRQHFIQLSSGVVSSSISGVSANNNPLSNSSNTNNTNSATNNIKNLSKNSRPISGFLDNGANVDHNEKEDIDSESIVNTDDEVSMTVQALALEGLPH